MINSEISHRWVKSLGASQLKSSLGFNLFLSSLGLTRGSINKSTSIFKAFLLILISIIFTGCASNKISQKNISAVLNDEKAVVIMKCEADIVFSGFFGLYKNIYNNQGCNTRWQIGSTKEYLRQSELKNIYVIDPGIYNLRSFEVKTDSNGSRYYASNIAHIASFEAYGGEVIYLGNIKFDLVRSNNISKIIAVSDQYEKIKIMMAKENPLLLPRLEKRLITLSGIHTEAIAEYDYRAPAPPVREIGYNSRYYGRPYSGL